jgi:Pyridoxamine 5'-phosphate oxidase
VSWRELERTAPELALLARERLEDRVAILGTVRTDGWPRLDPVEPVFAEGELLIGVGRSSAKARALRRDPRFALHAAAAVGDPDVKLRGGAVPSTVRAGWWRERAGEAEVYALALDEAVVIEWDLARERMRVRTWRPDAGERVADRAYP